MTKKTPKKSNAKKCIIVRLRAGQLCPYCGFAKLVQEPGNIIKCPVCGWGGTRRHN